MLTNCKIFPYFTILEKATRTILCYEYESYCTHPSKSHKIRFSLNLTSNLMTGLNVGIAKAKINMMIFGWDVSHSLNGVVYCLCLSYKTSLVT